MELEEIHKKVCEVDGKVDTLLQWKSGHDEHHKTIVRDMEEVRTTLFNNPGLKDKVLTLWNNKKVDTLWRDFYLTILRSVITAGIVSLVVWLLIIYKEH